MGLCNTDMIVHWVVDVMNFLILNLKILHSQTKLMYKMIEMFYLCLSSCHSAMCFPGWARTSFQCRNSSPLHCEERVSVPSSFLLADLCSFRTFTVITSFWTLLGSTVQVSASLKIGEQLSGFRLVRSLPMTLSPMVTCNLACESVK